MIQYVTIQYAALLERISFPVARFSDVTPQGPQHRFGVETDENNDFQKYLDSTKSKTYKPPKWDADADEISVGNPNSGDIPATGKRKTTSLAESDQTHRSVAGQEYRDTYTINERYDVLASLWNSPTTAELKPLRSSESRSRIRSLVIRDKEPALNQAKRFDTVFRLSLLTSQHEIIELEEAMSQGAHVPTESLGKMLTEYGVSRGLLVEERQG